jgi:hypothetical protein
MKITEIITEAKVPSVRDQIIADVKKHGPGDYFVRFTDIDKLGFSARQMFSHTPDVDHPKFDVDYIGHSIGRRALWFYPLKTYLDPNKMLYADEQPWVWLVKLKPNAWLQTVNRGDNKLESPPPGKERVGILRMSSPNAAIFFKPGFDVVGKYYDYAKTHKRTHQHGQVKGPSARPKPSFFDRVRGYK